MSLAMRLHSIFSTSNCSELKQVRREWICSSRFLYRGHWFGWEMASIVSWWSEARTRYIIRRSLALCNTHIIPLSSEKNLLGEGVRASPAWNFTFPAQSLAIQAAPLCNKLFLQLVCILHLILPAKGGDQRSLLAIKPLSAVVASPLLLTAYHSVASSSAQRTVNRIPYALVPKLVESPE